MNNDLKQKDLDELKRLDIMANLLDSRFRIPGTGIRFGFDALFSLLPVAGGILMYIPSLYLIARARSLKIGKWKLFKMAMIAGFDALFSSIPFLGSIFDIWFKANNRNVAIMKKTLERRSADAHKSNSVT